MKLFPIYVRTPYIQGHFEDDLRLISPQLIFAGIIHGLKVIHF